MHSSRKILISGRAAEIDPEEVIEFTLRSNFLEFAELQGSFTTTFSLPYKHSPTNQLIFQFAGNPKRSARGVLSLPFEFWWKGIRKYIGSVEIKQVQDKVDCTATVANGALNETAKDLFCDELELGYFTMMHKPVFSKEDGYCVPNMLDTDIIGWLGVANYWDEINLTYTNNIFGDPGNRLVPIAPCLYIKEACVLIFEYLGYSLIDHFFLDTVYAETVLLSLYDINQKSGTPPFVTPAIFPKAKLFPHITIADFIKGVSILFNVVFDFRGDDVKVYSRNYSLTSDFIQTKTSAIQNNLLQTKYSYGYEIDEKDTCYANWTDVKDLKREIVDWPQELTDGLTDASLPVDKKIYSESKYGDYYERKLYSDLTSVEWKFLSIHSAQTIGNNAEVIKSKILPIGFFSNWANDIDPSVRMPIVGSFYSDQNFTSFRIGFAVEYLGKQSFMSANGLNYLGNITCHLFNPNWSEDTIYNFEWKSFLDWLNDDAETIEATIEEESADYFFNRLDFTKRYVNQDGVKFILTEVVIGFNDKRMSKPKIKAVTMR